ncbi:MAG: FAD-binding protein, partial [Spirochaetaceae bacterium]|nr:FAD-binding protein [Spirochaetaceae bacterium]
MKKRLFITGTIVLVAAALIGACASGASLSGTSASGRFLSGLSWDAEYDVIVAGFGFAGATASITAADAGARVLLLEKAPEGSEGGNSRYAGQDILCPVAGHRDEAIQYYKGMRGEFDNQTDEMIEFMIDGAMANKDWLLKMGLDESTLVNRPWPEYPDLPGANDLSVMTIHINVTFRSDLYKFIHSLVDSRRDKIDVWYESPATRLIQDPNTKIIHGIELLHEGKTYRVRAKNGVVLAAGGFENNPFMLENFVQLADGYSKAARY